MAPTRLHYRRPPGRQGLDLVVSYDGQSEHYVVIDLSSAGMRVAGKRPVPAGKRLHLLLHIGEEQIEATGELVWCEDEDILYERYIIGIQFFVHDEQSREVLERYLATF
jgi:hypothetical protein